MRDDDAGPTGEQLDGVRKRGGHDWAAARDGVDQSTGGDLIGRVVGQDHDGRGLDEGGQHRNVAVTRIEAHRIRDAAAQRLIYSGIAVRFAIGGQHLRVRLARNQVPRPTGQIFKRPHRLDHPLDALARAQQAPGQHDGSTAPHTGSLRRDGRAVWDDGDFAAGDVEAPAQPLASRLRHHDHLVHPRGERLENRTLVWRRVFEDSVSDQDRWDAQSVDDPHDFVAIYTSVDAVLMLDDRDVALVQQLGACCDGCR
jgi:hypothetical protein